MNATVIVAPTTFPRSIRATAAVPVILEDGHYRVPNVRGCDDFAASALTPRLV